MCYFWSIKNLSEVIEKLRLRNFQGSQVSSFDFSTLYTFLLHDLIKAKVLFLVKWCFNRESKTYLCTSDKAGFFSNKKYDLSKPPQRRQGPDPRPLWLLVGTPLVLGPELASRRAEHSHSGGCHYIFLIYCFYHLTCVIIFMASPLQLAVGPRPSQGGLFTNF